ncbi:hypothetical protein [Chryseobacterium sp. JV558]|uniref:PD-(D/E)XK nuclease domain-containing protein n=1 Tax=Chryseobacterium sp. JV558 TaxID=2663236 RepID=UPI00299DA795|nr:hypothetical protein [Chryseobacterium sp. JV558]MDW9382775.1 hypothetical protein [Chryseobacterium sp. JV558]
MSNSLKIKIKEYYKLLMYTITKLDKLEKSLCSCEQGEELYIHERIENEQNKFSDIFKKLYFIIVEFLEQNNSSQILNIFKASYDEIFIKYYKLLFYEFDDDYGEYFYYSPKLYLLPTILEPFDILNEKDVLSIDYLENILNNTEYLLKNFNIVIDNETSINRSIRTILYSVFNDVSNIHEPFSKIAKCYKPDILIPSLKTCIEYKFAKDETRLINTIGEIYEDVHGYSNHPNYNLFYAVFYFQNPYSFPQNRFNEIIKEKKFPKEWKLLLINGN